MGLSRNLSKFKPSSDGLVEANDIEAGAVTAEKIAEGAIPPSGFQGGTNVTSADSVTLTSASTQVQRINITAANKFVILPDATTCTEGGVIFNIINVGTFPFSVVDSAGFSYGVINPSFAQSYFLGDNSTSAGKWATATAENATNIPSMSLYDVPE
jgi:uncharacterized protein (UPF0333 family)